MAPGDPGVSVRIYAPVQRDAIDWRRNIRSLLAGRCHRHHAVAEGVRRRHRLRTLPLRRRCRHAGRTAASVGGLPRPRLGMACPPLLRTRRTRQRRDSPASQPLDVLRGRRSSMPLSCAGCSGRPLGCRLATLLWAKVPSGTSSTKGPRPPHTGTYRLGEHGVPAMSARPRRSMEDVAVPIYTRSDERCCSGWCRDEAWAGAADVTTPVMSGWLCGHVM